MNNKEITAIIDMTQGAVEQLYLGESKKFLKNTHKDVVFMGEAEECYAIGAEKFAEAIEKCTSTIAECVIKNQKFKCVHSSKNIVVIVGLYTVLYNIDGTLRGNDERTTFVWTHENKKWQLVHIHISIPNESAVYEEGSNAAIYKQKFDLQKLAVKSENTDIIVVKDVEGNRHYITEDEIIYVEADNMNCIMHCLADTFVVRLTLKELQDMLSETFIRVHKSYIVNRHYVVNISRYVLSVIRDMEVPVSKEKYMEFKEFFAETIEKNKN